MKKQVCFLLALLMILIGCPALADVGDTPDTAIAITPGQAVTGSLVSDRDEDYYKLTLPADGMIYIGFLHDYVDSNKIYWKIDILDSGLHPYCTTQWWGDTLGERESRKLGLAAGTYYIHVYSLYYSPASYTMTVYYTPSDAWEKEWNNTPVDATTIAVNKEYSGALTMEDDVDEYQFTIPSDGLITLGFMHEYIDSTKNYWTIEILDSYKNVYLTRSFTGDAMVEKKTCNVGLPAGTYFLKIEPFFWSRTPYTFNLYYEPSTVFETEINNTPPQADTILLNTWYSGAIVDEDDKDYYGFELARQSQVSLSFKHKYIDSDHTYWVVRIIDINGNEQLNIGFRGNGAQDYTTDPITLGPGTYFVHVDDSYFSSSTYQFMIGAR